MSCPRYAVLACDVFAEELAAFGQNKPPWAALNFLAMGLHDQPDDLRAQIQEQVHLLEQTEGIETVVLAYGQCGNGLIGVKANRVPLVIPRAHDCVSILLGGTAQHQAALKENPGTYFYSPGWIRGKRVPGPDRELAIRQRYEARYGQDEDELIEDLVEADAETFAHHNCAAYVDLTDNTTAKRYCQECAHYLGWSFKELPGDPRYLTDLLSGRWEDTERFLHVAPGQALGMGSDGALTVVEA